MSDFLGKFAIAEGAKGGEYFTPMPIVPLIVEIIEPFSGRILDPTCGSGGMFVQSARFLEEVFWEAYHRLCEGVGRRQMQASLEFQRQVLAEYSMNGWCWVGYGHDSSGASAIPRCSLAEMGWRAAPQGPERILLRVRFESSAA